MFKDTVDTASISKFSVEYDFLIRNCAMSYSYTCNIFPVDLPALFLYVKDLILTVRFSI